MSRFRVTTRGRRGASSDGFGAARQLSRCMYWGTSFHFTLNPAPWAQKTESGVLGRSASGS